MKNNDVITVENEGHIAWVILCRPQKRNAFKLSFFTKFAQVFQQISEDPAVRVVVIRAEGKDFSVGMDLQDGAAELILDASQRLLIVRLETEHEARCGVGCTH